MSHSHLHDKIAREILTSGEGGDFDLANYDADSCETLVTEVRTCSFALHERVRVRFGVLQEYVRIHPSRGNGGGIRISFLVSRIVRVTVIFFPLDLAVTCAL